MADWTERVEQEVRAIASAPIVAAAALAIAFVGIWGVLHWSYRAALANKDAYIAVLERRVAEYREKLGGASADEARARIDALETEIKTLRIRMQPRHLSPAQQQAILDRSRLPAGAKPYAITVLRQETCSDCASFAASLIDTLHASGSWNISLEVVPNPPEKLRHGIGIRIAEPLRPPEAATLLQRVLLAAGLSVEMVAGGSGENVELLVLERLPQ